jgi:hypothetical protein
LFRGKKRDKQRMKAWIQKVEGERARAEDELRREKKDLCAVLITRVARIFLRRRRAKVSVYRDFYRALA